MACSCCIALNGAITCKRSTANINATAINCCVIVDPPAVRQSKSQIHIHASAISRSRVVGYCATCEGKSASIVIHAATIFCFIAISRRTNISSFNLERAVPNVNTSTITRLCLISKYLTARHSECSVCT